MSKNIDFCVGEAMNVLNKKGASHLSPEMLERVRARRFTVKDTGLTHRQMNYLTSNSIMDDGRDSDSQWRRFNMKELVFLAIVADLRKYGVKDTLLAMLSRAFFEGMNNRAIEVMMFAALAGEKIYITIEGDGSVGFYNITMHQLYHSKTPCHLNINFNEYVTAAWHKGKEGAVEYRDEIQYLQEILNERTPTSREEALLAMIRNGKYRSFKIRRADNDQLIVNATNVSKVQEKEILKALGERDFIDVELKKRDGKVVHIAFDDIFLI